MQSHKKFMQLILAGEELSVNKDKTRFKLDQESGNIIITKSVMSSLVGKPLTGFTVYEEFEIVPKTIFINGIEVPCPIHTPLEKDQEYWVVDLTDEPEDILSYNWYNDQKDSYWLRCGLIHLSEENMMKHREALLSFTRLQEDEKMDSEEMVSIPLSEYE